MSGTEYTDAVILPLLERIHAGESMNSISKQSKITRSTLRSRYHRWLAENNLTKAEPKIWRKPEAAYTLPIIDKKPSKILIYDIETLPNLGYFWDTFSDRSIPLDFILKPKSICTIAYKWYGEPETYALVVEEPYNDKAILEAFLPEWSKADYAVAHYSRFDKPFIAARLMANGLPSLPPVNDICTYKLAKAHFGRSLNGNKLDHLGTILGVGNKIKTSADLWVGCAAGDKDALAKMADYNRQDVALLSDVFKAMLPYVKSKLNLNLMVDEPILRCKACGSDHIEPRGYEYTSSTMRHRYLCQLCGSWSSFPRSKSPK